GICCVDRTQYPRYPGGNPTDILPDRCPTSTTIQPVEHLLLGCLYRPPSASRFPLYGEHAIILRRCCSHSSILQTHSPVYNSLLWAELLYEFNRCVHCCSIGRNPIFNLALPGGFNG